MHKRPSLSEALSFLQKHKLNNAEVSLALDDYSYMRSNGHDFRAARYVVDIVDHYNKQRSAA